MLSTSPSLDPRCSLAHPRLNPVPQIVSTAAVPVALTIRAPTESPVNRKHTDVPGSRPRLLRISIVIAARHHNPRIIHRDPLPRSFNHHPHSHFRLNTKRNPAPVTLPPIW